jgi:2-amino-4-hydroxy-6-hydroxymethyldihydropteridine diphosphokinase
VTNKCIKAYLALGTNLGDKRLNLLIAIAGIAGKIGVLSAISSVYETEPWGFESRNSFLNMVVCVETELSPLELLKATQEIEKKMGRTEKTGAVYKDRIIDIDIILYGDLTYQSEELTLPHPLYKQRAFVLEPLKEIRLEVL